MKTVRLAIALFAFAFAASAEPVSTFLSEVKFESATKGTTNAIAKLERRLAQGGLTAADVAQVQTMRGTLMAKTPGRLRDGAAVLQKEVILKEGVDPKLKLSAANALLGIYAEQELRRPPVELLRRMLDLPEFKVQGTVRGDLLMKLGDAYSARHFRDFAHGAYRDAAKCFAAGGESDRQADALLAAARSALGLRDVPLAQSCYREALAVPGLDGAKAQVVRLRLGESEIFHDQHGWKPSPERVAKARATIEGALAPQGRTRAISIDDENRVLQTLLRAEAQSGNLAGAVEIGKRLVDDPHRTIDKKVRANIAADIGDYLAQLKKPKEAIRYYEMSLSPGFPDCGGKAIHYRIANIARASKDYARAMQAYSDAIGFCDRIEGKGEIKRLQNLAGQMSRIVSGKDKGVEADDVFRDGGGSIGNLDLDEP